MFPLVIYRILCVACWLCAGLQLCCAIDKLKEEQTARINCTRTCAHLTKDLVRTQLSYEVRNTIRDHFSFTWISCKFTCQTSLHCAYIMLLNYITLIEKQSSGLHITASSSPWKVSETLLLVAGLSLQLVLCISHWTKLGWIQLQYTRIAVAFLVFLSLKTMKNSSG